MTARFSPRTGSLAGLSLLPVGAALLIVALLARSLPVLVVGVVVGGAGLGTAFRSGLLRITALAPDERRGEVTSTFFVVTYAGLTVPVVAAGLLVTYTTLLTAIVSLTVFIAVLAVSSIGILLRSST